MVGDVVVEVEVDPGVEVGVLAEECAILVGSIPWLVTGVGCMAIWPITIPALVVHRKVMEALAHSRKFVEIWVVSPKTRKR